MRRLPLVRLKRKAKKPLVAFNLLKRVKYALKMQLRCHRILELTKISLNTFILLAKADSESLESVTKKSKEPIRHELNAKINVDLNRFRVMTKKSVQSVMN